MDSMAVIETLCDTFISEASHPGSANALALRFAVAEGCKNALSQRAPKGEVNVASVSFFPHPCDSAGAPSVEIQDPGAGLSVDGHLPPYPPHLVNRETVLTRVMDQVVIALVEDRYSVRLRWAAEPGNGGGPRTRNELPCSLHPGGFGLLMLCRSWKNVVFIFRPGEGTNVQLGDPRLPDD